jgi:large subunit ribosomal protein L10
MTNITQVKRDKVDSFSKELQAASIIFFTDYRGLKVSDITSLRKSLRKENARGIVIKNTMSKLAFQKLGLTVIDSFFEGPSFVVLSSGDVAKVSKAIINFKEDCELFQVKGGLLDKVPVSGADIVALSKLPSKEELISKVVYMVKSPLSGFVRQLASPLTRLILVLNAIQDKKSNK